MKNCLVLYLLLPLFILSGCDHSSSTDGTAVQTPISLERPSDAAVILSRDIGFKNNEHISYCEVLKSENQSYSGYRDEALYPLASLSKVVTTAWALKKLGPDYTFQTDWSAAAIPNRPGVFDVYLRTNYDPVFNIEKVLYFISELHQHGISQIRTLTIDETTRVYLSALSLPHLELQNVPVSTEDSLQNLELVLNSSNWSKQTAAAKEKMQAWSIENNKTFSLPSTFTVENVEFKKSTSIDRQKYTSKNHFNSARLLQYLKNLNVYSNNYVTDSLFSYLGGAENFKKFQSAELNLTSQQLQFYTGSGLATSQKGARLDNSGSCLAFLKVLKYVDRLAESNGLNLGHFLYNPTRDLDGTFDSKLNFKDQIVFKTGRLFENPALNLAGIIATEKGSLYFTFLGHGFLDSEVNLIESARDSILTNTLNYYPVQSPFLTLKNYQILL